MIIVKLKWYSTLLKQNIWLIILGSHEYNWSLVDPKKNKTWVCFFWPRHFLGPKLPHVVAGLTFQTQQCVLRFRNFHRLGWRLLLQELFYIFNVGPPNEIAKLVNMTPITMVYYTYHYTIFMGFINKLSYRLGAPHWNNIEMCTSMNLFLWTNSVVVHLWKIDKWKWPTVDYR